MNIDSLIIKYLLHSNYYNKYYKYLNIDHYKNNNKLIYKILVVLSKLHEDYKKEAFNSVELLTAIHAAYPALKPDEEEFFTSFLSKLAEVEIDPALADSLFDSYRYKSVAHRIAANAIEVVEGHTDFVTFSDFVEKELETTKSSKTASDQLFCMDVGLGTILSPIVASKGLKWRLKTLSKVFGDLQKGDFGFIFARPEVGKTTFLASEASNFITQSDKPILWVNNEQRGSAVILRFYSAYFGVSEAEIRNNADKYNKMFKEQVGDKFKFIDDPSIHRSKIEDVCANLEPSVMIFDQLDKVAGFEGERYDLVMKMKYQWARELAKKYGVGIGVSQAGGTAENKKYLDMNDVDSSHTAKQSETDWIIGIGKTNDVGFEAVRYLSVCKNKLPHSEGMEPSMRHAKTEVFINEDIARYEDKYNW